MSTANGQPDTARRHVLSATGWIGIAALVVALDQWTKRLIIERFAEFDTIVLLPVLELMRLHNEGAAFSILAGASGWQRWMFVSLGIGVSVGILIWLYRLPARGQTLLAVALSFVMGGALGNVIDRVRFGYVVDFIRVHYEDWYFPAFNVADSAITIGAALLILDSIIHSAPRSAAPIETKSADNARGAGRTDGGDTK
jgi:signal peptidase II